MTSVASRLKDALWSVRRKFGMESDIDRLIPYLAFEREVSDDQFNALFATYPKRIPEAFKPALFAHIKLTMRLYYQYRRFKRQYHKLITAIAFIENVVRYGFEKCNLVPDNTVGYKLQLKANVKSK